MFVILLVIINIFLEKNNILYILKGEMPLKIHKIEFFSRKPKKNSRFRQ